MVRSTPSPHDAFTLLELTLVILMIGVLTAVLVPEFRGTRDAAEIRDGAQRLLMACRIARAQAVSTRYGQELELDVSERRFAIVSRRPEDEPPSRTPAREVSGTLGKTIRIALRKLREQSFERTRQRAFETRNGPRKSIRFYPDGTSDGGEIVLSDASGNGYMLRIDPTTSQTEIRKTREEVQP